MSRSTFAPASVAALILRHLHPQAAVPTLPLSQDTIPLQLHRINASIPAMSSQPLARIPETYCKRGRRQVRQSVLPAPTGDHPGDSHWTQAALPNCTMGSASSRDSCPNTFPKMRVTRSRSSRSARAHFRKRDVSLTVGLAQPHVIHTEGDLKVIMFYGRKSLASNNPYCASRSRWARLGTRIKPGHM